MDQGASAWRTHPKAQREPLREVLDTDGYEPPEEAVTKLGDLWLLGDAAQ